MRRQAATQQHFDFVLRFNEVLLGQRAATRRHSSPCPAHRRFLYFVAAAAPSRRLFRREGRLLVAAAVGRQQQSMDRLASRCDGLAARERGGDHSVTAQPWGGVVAVMRCFCFFIHFQQRAWHRSTTEIFRQKSWGQDFVLFVCPHVCKRVSLLRHTSIGSSPSCFTATPKAVDRLYTIIAP